jgi:hypothetical protein
MLGRMTALDVISRRFAFSGYFICYISMLLPAGVRGEPKAAF